MKESLSESPEVLRPAASLIVLLGLLAYSTQAQAGSIQMLPPTDFSGNTCTSATGGLLQWDGTTPIKCVPGVSGDASGDLSANANISAVGTVTPGLATAGQTCSPVGAIAHDATGAPLNCINGVWTSGEVAKGALFGYCNPNSYPPTAISPAILTNWACLCLDGWTPVMTGISGVSGNFSTNGKGDSSAVWSTGSIYSCIKN